MYKQLAFDFMNDDILRCTICGKNLNSKENTYFSLYRYEGSPVICMDCFNKLFPNGLENVKFEWVDYKKKGDE